MHYVVGQKISFIFILGTLFVLSGCLSGDVPRSRPAHQAIPVGESISGAGAGATSSGSANGDASSITPKVELRHIVEPNLSTDPNYSSGTGFAGGGSYVRKLTLPKNFRGKLYLAGINIGTLSDRHVKVRFKFGVGRESITLPAVIAKAPGITPQTQINVLVMDLRSEPLRNMRLPYDLYDYNEYSVNQTPTQDNRDSGLFCRGLRVEDDPTFNGQGECDGNEECLYAYAKVLDQGLVQEVVNGSSIIYMPLTPSLPQVRSAIGSAYYQDSMAQIFKRPLADNVSGPFKISETAVPLNSTDSINLDFWDPISGDIDWTAKSVHSINYYYRGPYRLINKYEWHFKSTDLAGEKKLFKYSREYPPTAPAVAVPETNKVYYNSYMFPLATQVDLLPNVPHLSSALWADLRSETSLSVASKTLWMDGANARAQSKNSELEHIGSCNVSASIEIIAKDKNDNDYVISLSKDVKIQLVRPILHSTDTGNDVLYSNFKTCSSNASCGGNECCFNQRCWDQTLVSQCFDASSTQGNRMVGETCLSDLECSSLCCNRTSGLCAPHNNIQSPNVLCSKPIGDFCIAKEWCQKTPIVRCLIVRTGTTPTGQVTCRQQCYTTEEYGECKSGMCVAPYQESIPVFDPNDPAACNNAVPAPRF